MARDRLANLRLAFNCDQRWEDMVGDDRVRACRGCNKDVFNLSAMTRAEAEAVLDSRACVRFYRRADGTVMTSDCPSGAPKRRLGVVASSVAATLAAAPALADTVNDAGTIEGTLTEHGTGEPAAGATVVVTGPALDGQPVAISDELGFYRIDGLPPGEYVVTIYYDDATIERSGVKVEHGRISLVSLSIDAPTARGERITITRDYFQGIPVPGRTFEGVLGEVGVVVAVEKRPAVEWSLWGRLGAGVMSQPSDVAARRVTPEPDASGSTWEAALGADASFGVAHHDDLRLGAWGEARTTTGPVGGAELVLEGLSPHPYASRIGGAGSLVLRAGGNTRVLTAALGLGYVGSFPNGDPWVSWARHVVAARVMLSVNRAAEDPRDWSATVGLEVDPIGAVHALFDVFVR